MSVHSLEGIARAEALIAAAARAELPTPEVLVLPQDHSVLARYKDPDAPHTALVCFSDELARHVLTSCRQYGVSVPEQVSVVGFDSSPLCELTQPRLTSVSQPVERMASEATHHLLNLIRAAEEGKPAPTMTSILYDCPIDVRDSTGPAPR